MRIYIDILVLRKYLQEKYKLEFEECFFRIKTDKTIIEAEKNAVVYTSSIINKQEDEEDDDEEDDEEEDDDEDEKPSALDKL